MTSPPTPSPSRSAAGTVLRGAGLILVITVFARIAGFLRYLVFGGSVGAGDVGTAYATANLLPNVLFEVVAGGALAAVVVPLVAGLIPEGDRTARGPDAVAATAGTTTDGPATTGAATSAPGASATAGPGTATSDAEGARRADRIISTLLTWVLLVTMLLTAVVIALARPLAELLLLTEDATGDAAVALGARLLRIFAAQLPFYGIAVVLGSYLQARRRFLWPAMMPLISSLVVMVAYRVYAMLVPAVATTSTIPESAILWLGWGTTAGVVVMAAPVTLAALRSGLRLRPRLRMPAGYGRRALGLGGAGLGAVGAQQLVTALIMVMAIRAGGTGTLPVFQYAQALYLLPYAVLVVPLVTAVFPHLSEMRLVGDTVGFARAAGASLRTVIAVAVIGGAMLFAGAPALEQFFRLIDRAGAIGVGSATAALSIGLAGYAIAIHCTRVLSAALRARDALLVGSVGWIIAGVLLLLMVATGPTRSAAEAATAFGLCIAVGMVISAVVGVARISDILEPGGDLPALRRTLLLALPAFAIGAIPGLLLGKLMVTTETGAVLAVLSGLASGLAAALLAAALLAAVDPALTRQLVSRLRRRPGSGR
jgi:putative peptidoglycan lipid II flippase